MATDSRVDFFERQRAARGTTLKLVLLFALGVLAVVAVINLVVYLVVHNEPGGTQAGWLVAVTIITVLVIAGGSLAKIATLRGGGAAVALSVGAVPVDPATSDPQLKRYANVVEEMSIASGVPMPRLFVLPREEGINAFAAGYSPNDAAVTVTAGALNRLNRDELQGVIGHEFSHILNGDMRVNVRLMGLLAGLLVLGLVGLRILQFGGGNRRSRDGSAILLFGIAALVLGFVGQFFAGLIKAAVSRQREWLADASAVQFTRQTVGLAGALKKIAGVPGGSALGDTHTERQINHMLFGEGARSLSQLWATHPPVLARIQALEPGFQAEQIQQLQQRYAQARPDGMAEDRALGLVGTGPSVPAQEPELMIRPDEVTRRVGTFSTDDLERGAAISRTLPAELRQLATQPSTAVPLVLALLLDADDAVRTRELGEVSDRLGASVAHAAEALRATAETVPPLLRIPLVDIALPALSTRPRAEVHAVVSVIDALARADATWTVFEYCLSRLVASYLRDTLDPLPRTTPGRAGVAKVQDAAITLLAVVAAEGNPDPAAQERAYRAGLTQLGLPGRPYEPPRDVFAALDAVWAPLDALQPQFKRPLVAALAAAVADDGVLHVAEAELLRTACSLLHCPIPALLA